MSLKGIRAAHVTTTDLTLEFLLKRQLSALADEGATPIGISARGPWTAALEDHGVEHVDWPHATRSWRPSWDLRAFFELWRILRSRDLHVVHTHNPKPGLMGRIAARAAGVPCIVNTVHGFYAAPTDPPVKKAVVLGLEWIAARMSDVELYQSEEDLGWSLARGVVPSRKAIALGNGVDLARLDPGALPPGTRDRVRAELGAGPSDVVVGTIGRLVREKGIFEFADAARLVRERSPSARFVAVGDPDPEKADSLTREQLDAASPHVTFTGWRTDIPEVLSALDVFVLASWREGLPRSAIEAAAMGLPLVVTDIRGCREVVRDQEEGLLVPPGDAAALAAAIQKVVDDPSERERMGRAARARAQDRFDERRVVETVLDAYRRVLVPKGHVPLTDGVPEVRYARAGDAAEIAHLHATGLPDAFLPRLGEAFLRVLYRWMIRDENSIVLVARDGTSVVGFVAGTMSVAGFYRRFFVRRGAAALVVAVPALARRGALRGAWESARYSRSIAPESDVELLAMAVAPGSRGKGAGRILATAFMNELAGRGADYVQVVVGGANEGAQRFYRTVGFDHVRDVHVHQGSRSVLMVARCSSPSPRSSR